MIESKTCPHDSPMIHIPLHPTGGFYRLPKCWGVSAREAPFVYLFVLTHGLEESCVTLGEV